MILVMIRCDKNLFSAVVDGLFETDSGLCRGFFIMTDAAMRSFLRMIL